MNIGRSGRKRTGRCQENIDIVQEALENNPRGVSCRKNGLNLPSATFNRTVSKDLNWHPYRMQRRHGLKAGDFERRLPFCNWFSGHGDDHRFIPSMIIGDEAGFSNVLSIGNYSNDNVCLNSTYNIETIEEQINNYQIKSHNMYLQRKECLKNICENTPGRHVAVSNISAIHKQDNNKNDDVRLWPKDTILITGDSILNGLEENRMRNIGKHTVKIRAFPGANVLDMYSYITPLLKKIRLMYFYT